MYLEWLRSPALQTVFSLRVDRPALPRHALNRSSHGPAATGTVARRTGAEAKPDRVERSPIARTAATSGRRCRAGDLRKENLGIGKTCLVLANSLRTTANRRAILRWHWESSIERGTLRGPHAPLPGLSRNFQQDWSRAAVL